MHSYPHTKTIASFVNASKQPMGVKECDGKKSVIDGKMYTLEMHGEFHKSTLLITLIAHMSPLPLHCQIRKHNPSQNEIVSVTSAIPSSSSAAHLQCHTNMDARSERSERRTSGIGPSFPKRRLFAINSSPCGRFLCTCS